MLHAVRGSACHRAAGCVDPGRFGNRRDSGLPPRCCRIAAQGDEAREASAGAARLRRRHRITRHHARDDPESEDEATDDINRSEPMARSGHRVSRIPSGDVDEVARDARGSVGCRSGLASRPGHRRSALAADTSAVACHCCGFPLRRSRVPGHCARGSACSCRRRANRLSVVAGDGATGT